MADDLKDIGQEDVFPLPLNWISNPSTSFTITRHLQHFAGTSASISELNPETPISFEGLFSVFEKQEEYDLMEFIHSRKGRVIRFWIPYEKEMFTLVTPTSVGATALECEDNKSTLSYLGYERIFLLMRNGDMITRHVTEVTSSLGKITLTLTTPLDRDIELNSYYTIGRFLLVRFDSDKFEFSVDTNNVFEFSSRFYELVKEYSELAPNP